MTRFAALITLACTSAAVHAETVAYWNFNSLVAAPNTAKVIGSDLGSATLYADGQFGSSNWASSASNPQITAFQGSAINALNADVAGQALALANNTANGFSIVFAFSMAGLQDLEVSYATRGTATGFSSQTWAWSTDASNFTTFQTVTGTTATSFFLASLNTLSALDNATTAYLRLTFSGASSAAGNNRLDNIQFNATQIAVVPLPPAAWAGLATLASVVGYRRLRRA